MERLVFDLVSFGPWLSHVLSRAVFFVIKVVIKVVIKLGYLQNNLFTEKVTLRYRTTMLHNNSKSSRVH